MSVDREACYEALRSRLAGALEPLILPGVSMPDGWHVSRLYRDFDDPSCEQPCCLVVATTQKHLEDPGRPARWELAANALVYFRNQDPQIVTDTLANKVIDAIDASLDATMAETDGYGEFHTDLGGLVRFAEIGSGPVAIFQGLP